MWINKIGNNCCLIILADSAVNYFYLLMSITGFEVSNQKHTALNHSSRRVFVGLSEAVLNVLYPTAATAMATIATMESDKLI